MKKKEIKKQYSYRAKPSIVNKAQKKAVKENKTLSEKVENLLSDYILPEPEVKQVVIGDMIYSNGDIK